MVAMVVSKGSASFRRKMQSHATMTSMFEVVAMGSCSSTGLNQSKTVALAHPLPSRTASNDAVSVDVVLDAHASIRNFGHSC